MHANCSSLLSRLKCTCVRACVCVQGELGSGAMAVMWKMKLVFAVLLVSSQSSSERESRGVGEKMHACPPPHTHTHSERCCKWEHYGTIWYSWHANKHTPVCHPLSPEQINKEEKSIPIRILLLCPACGCRWIDTETPLLTCRYS